MLRKISVFICTLFLFQTILLPSGRAYISTSDSPLKLTLNNYELNKEGVLLFKFLKVSIPDRSVRFFSTDLDVPGIGFSLKIERVYSALSFHQFRHYRLQV